MALKASAILSTSIEPETSIRRSRLPLPISSASSASFFSGEAMPLESRSARNTPTTSNTANVMAALPSASRTRA